MAFDLKSLELFTRVAALGAIGKAGAEFQLSATNASQRIQTLETSLGVKLLNRTTRSVSLTSDGEVLLEHARRILDSVDDARRVLSHNADSVSGTLRVTASASFGTSHIVPFIPAFLERYPQVSLDLNLTDAIVDIVDQGYDLAFRIGELAPSSLLAQRIDDNPRILVASPDYLTRAGHPQKPQDLVNHACLPLNQHSNWQLAGPDGHIHDVRVSGPIASNLGTAIAEWVKTGLGIGIASLWLVGPDLQSGQVVPVLPGYQLWPDSKMWAVRPPGRIMHARVKAFMDFMRHHIIATNRARCGNLDISKLY